MYKKSEFIKRNTNIKNVLSNFEYINLSNIVMKYKRM